MAVRAGSLMEKRLSRAIKQLPKAQQAGAWEQVRQPASGLNRRVGGALGVASTEIPSTSGRSAGTDGQGIGPTVLPPYLPPAVPQDIPNSFTLTPSALDMSTGPMTPGGGQPGNGLDWGTILRGAATVFLGDRLTASSSSSSLDCAPGRIKVGTRCVDPGAALPGGTPLMVPAGGGGVGMGIFGAPAVMPTVVGEITTERGETNVIRRCPAGTVLGKDELCYAKGSIPNKLRKWPKAAKPPVSAYDARMMNKYGPKGSKRNRVKDLAMKAGFACKNK